MTDKSSNIPNSADANKLTQVAQIAYLQNPGNCSGAVYYVIKTLVDGTARYLLANALMLKISAPNRSWRHVIWQDTSILANQGKVVVGGLVEPGHHGHVIIVLPGPWKPSGGYKAHGKIVSSHGHFPPAMSTALPPPGGIAWPGAIGDGDKTIRDPWSKANWSKVTFWTKQ